MEYDIIVIGGGPAGASFCRYISKRYSVLLIEKRQLDPQGNYLDAKACGGLLNLECQRELSVQSLAIPKGVLQEPQMFTVRAFDFDNRISKHYQKSYLNVDRALFDSFLLSRIASHVDLLPASLYLSHEIASGAVRVKVKQGEKILDLTCKRLIDASGAIAAASKKMHARPDYYACIQRHYRTKERLPYLFSVFDKHVTDYYSWGIQKADTLIVGSAISDTKRAKEKFERLLERLEEIGFDLSHEEKREGSLLLRPKRMGDVFLGAKPIHVIGEAASLISPSSSEGISFALRSGRFLADSMNRSFVNYPRAYERAARSLKIAMFVKEKKARLMYSKNSRRLIMKSGVLSTKVRGEKTFTL